MYAQSGNGVEAITNTYKNAAFPYRESEQGGLKLLILHLVHVRLFGWAVFRMGFCISENA